MERDRRSGRTFTTLHEPCRPRLEHLGKPLLTKAPCQREGPAEGSLIGRNRATVSSLCLEDHSSHLTISHGIWTLDCMVTRTTTLLVDDLTGDPANTTVRFALDSHEYELDLTDKNAAEFREALSRYVKAARKVSGGRRGVPASKPAFSEVDPAAVRAWAAGQGIEVSPRGRVSKNVVEQYRAAGN